MSERQGSTESPERSDAASDSTPAERWAGGALANATDAPERKPTGRPRGARDSRPRKRRGGGPRPARVRQESGDAEVVSPDAPVTDAELVGAGKMLGVAWRIAGSRLNRRPLTPGEERELAEASVPLMRKYGGGFLEQYGAEIAFGMVVWGLWERTRVPDPDPALVETFDLDSPAGEVVGA